MKGITTSIPRARQEGFVLVTALILLVVMTVLAISSMSTNTLEERMAGYVRDRQIALQAAEAALRDAERDIAARVHGDTGFLAGCNTDTAYHGLCLVEADGTPIWRDFEASGHAEHNVWVKGTGTSTGRSVAYGGKTNAGTYTIDGTNAPVQQPRYIIESLAYSGGGSRKIGFSASSTGHVYRVTAVGYGRRDTTRVVLQAVYRQ
jgi:type IV pilus assembly protein PilX